MFANSELRFNKFLHFSLFIVSTFMSIMMFVLIGTSFATKASLVFIAVIFEWTKLTDLHRFGGLGWSVKKVLLGSSYLFKAFLSIIPSVGLVLVLLAAQDNVAQMSRNSMNSEISVFTDQVSYWQTEIEKLDDTLKLLNENLDRNPSGYGLASKSFVGQIESIQNRKDLYHTNYTIAVEERNQKLQEISTGDITVNPADMFIVLGDALNIDSQKIRIFVFVSIMIIIEFSLFLTCPDIEKKTILDRNMKNMGSQKDAHSNNIVWKSFDIQNLPDKGRRATLAIAQLQARREESYLPHLTQLELAEELNTTHAIINNMVRRYVNPIMNEYGLRTYGGLYDLLVNSKEEMIK